MYFVVLPLFELAEISQISRADRLDVIKKSLLFKSCRKNSYVSYSLVLLDVIFFTLFVTVLYLSSIKMLPIDFMWLTAFPLLVFYIVLSIVIYGRFDNFDGRTEYQDVEAAEGNLSREESSQEMSVQTDFFN